MDEPQVPVENLDPFEVQIVRDCGCTIWRFRFDPWLGLEPDDEADPFEWWGSATGTGRHAIRTLEAPKAGTGRRFHGSRGSSGQRHVPKVDGDHGELVLTGTNLCPHATRELKATKGKELHRWHDIAKLIDKALAGGADPTWPIKIELVHVADSRTP